MERHLIKYIGSAAVDYHTSTYCGMQSDEWSEDFAERPDKTLTQKKSECTCKGCLDAHKKELARFEYETLKYQLKE